MDVYCVLSRLTNKERLFTYDLIKYFGNSNNKNIIIRNFSSDRYNKMTKFNALDKLVNAGVVKKTVINNYNNEGTNIKIKNIELWNQLREELFYENLLND